MEAKVIDFNQPLETQLGKIKNNNNDDQTKNQDFIKKLNSATKKTEPTDGKLNKKIEKSKDEVVETVEEVEKKDKVLYEGMVNLLNIKPMIQEEVEEVELTIVPIEADKKLTEELILEEEFVNLINLPEDENHLEKTSKVELEDDSKELNIQNQINSDKEEVKSELDTENTTKKEVNIKPAELDEDTFEAEENNIINIEQKTNEETQKEFDGEKQSGERKSDTGYELVRSSSDEETLDVKNESFAPFIKDGVEFSSERPMEVEVPVEPKEVVKQIIDQVKFDLSENKNEMKLTLKPAILGEMTMNVEVAKDGIIAKIMVDNYRTKEIIEGNIVQLKEGIKDTGMEIKTFEVFVGNGSDFDQHNSSQFNLNQNNKKLKIRNKNNDEVKDYENGTIKDEIQLRDQTLEGGLNLLA